MKPASSFRSHYAYDNLLYMTAGQIIPAVTGISWDDYVRQRIFAPLGMTHSTVTNANLEPTDDVAVPHSRVDGKLHVRPLRSTRQRRPRGSNQFLRSRYGQVGAAATEPRQIPS